MKKRVELTFCDYCNSTELNKIANNTCNLCGKSYCEDCKDKELHEYTGRIQLGICKHCVKSLSKVVSDTSNNERDKLFPRKIDYRMSGNGYLIDIGTYYRQADDEFVLLARKMAREVFFDRARKVLEDKWKNDDVKKKEEEMRKKLEQEIENMRRETLTN